MKNEQLHEKREFENVRALVEWAADTYGDKTAFSYRPTPKSDKETVSYIKLRDDVRALASELYSMGCAGKPIVLIGKMSYERSLMYYAALSIGAILVPLDKDWGALELAETAKRADGKFLFLDCEIAEKAPAVAEALELAAPTAYLGYPK